MKTVKTIILPLILITLWLPGCRKKDGVIQRPEKILSMREVVYGKQTYTRLASLWEQYYKAYPSEDAYANWMYAARYAGAADYTSLLDAGVGSMLAVGFALGVLASESLRSPALTVVRQQIVPDFSVPGYRKAPSPPSRSLPSGRM